MEKIKCGQCGLVNWQGGVSCVRCKAMLNAGMSSGLNPFENETNAKGGFNPVLIGLVALVVVGLGFAVYQVVKPAPVPVKVTQAEAAPQAEVAPQVLDPQKVGQMLQDPGKKETEAIKKIGAEWQSSKFDKEQMQKAVKAPQVQKFPNVPPGGFGPPGAGVPYHTR